MTAWIKKEHVALGVQANNWEEAIQASGALLLKTGAVTTDYVQQMIDSVKENGPYIVIGPGIAMAHARPSEAVKEDAISLAVLEQAVSFGSEQNDPVDLIFSFSATGADSHLKMIERLSHVLIDEEKVNQLRQATSIETITNLN
ncbi:PTS system ascorbate-specific IIA component [Alkalihalobacillus xiaoxiensis]|uniref:Ascorbate-specific PTS system EIIA component n=1 Tax=Shouchella xiaoxiensis TaxID=766895 RepID=A0ABS2SP77_9BACI|nr:PTS sugar transporter subunit IIA [Shouchella xiaoxiensis]MBM7836801.1 PTS system ascorbate-specific IIA component [Shouchella xiaoxiensis]